MRDRRTERDTERGWRDTDRNRETERVEMKRQRKTAETERQGRQREIGRQRETARKGWWTAQDRVNGPWDISQTGRALGCEPHTGCWPRPMAERVVDVSRPCRKRRPSAREDGGVSGVSSSCGARGGFLPSTPVLLPGKTHGWRVNNNNTERQNCAG